jgi:photosystem II stability/assembly factor-like uncharacterized protein
MSFMKNLSLSSHLLQSPPISSRFLLLLLLVSSSLLLAQPAATNAADRLKGMEQRKILAQNSPAAAVDANSIGPSVFSCRVTDVDADPGDPARFYVAYASGGLWYTESNGTAFVPVFDQEASMTIGDIAADWKRDVVWVGTGEANSSRSSYAGTGVYRSSDGGKTWAWMGLPESHHISRIILHPTDPNTLWVAVLGHLYSPNPERGVYKTTDGGTTWSRTLFVDENSGAIDLCLDPQNPNTLYAATWERERRSWNFKGAGKGSGIWKSTDSGNTWQLLSTPSSGFPTGENTGRIGLCAGLKNGKTVLYASLDNQNPKPKKQEPAKEGLPKDALRSISKEDFLKLEDEKIENYLRDNGFPEKYTAEKVRDLVGKDKIKPQALVEYLEDANSLLFDVDYIGAEVYRSEDGGQTWKRTHEEPLDGINFTYGYYFSTVYCRPDDADKVYLLGFLIIRSEDGGKTWKNINGDNVHVDHHSLWVNPSRHGHLINGNDGGVNISWDNGASWLLANTPPVGQFYAIAVDNADPYNVYGGAQDNGVWVGPSNYTASTDWHQSGQYPYESLLGGDGMQVAVDTRDNNTVYTGFQFGNYFRIDRRTGRRKPISPKHELGERPYRFNWQTPIWLSKHNQDILYMGAQKLFRSFDRGDNWEAISGDLTGGGAKGNVPYGTLTTVHESPLRFGLLYTGSDDGQVHVSRDGGENWRNITFGLPEKMWVSSLRASAHEKGRAYLALNGYRWDDFNAYVYLSDDYGQNWTRIGADLPAEPVNALREDPVNPDLLYVGTDHGVYVSLDRGQSFQRLSDSLPAVPVHDLVVHPTAADLLVGTHGRSMFKVSVKQLQQLNRDVLAKALHVFDITKQKYNRNWGRKPNWSEPREPVMPVHYYVKTAGKITWSIKTQDGLVLNSGERDCVKGLNSLNFVPDLQEKQLKVYLKSLNESQKDPKKMIDLTKAENGKYYLYKGSYILEFAKEGLKAERKLIIE